MPDFLLFAFKKMNSDRVKITITSFISALIIIGAFAYIGYMIASTETKQENEQKQKQNNLIASIGGGVVGIIIVLIIYKIIHHQKSQSFSIDQKVLSRYSRFVPDE
jgi:membrane protein DedA with SNARE-associated domain